ncbi:MAG: MarR family transcriptional regulator [Solirubrobacterales bacterium]|nr:MarR family transcriptional regulator [Solirubrobacterales bacterium]
MSSNPHTDAESVEATRADVSGLFDPDADSADLPDDVVETSLLIGTLFRRMFSYGDGGSALRLMDEHQLSFLEFKAMLELGAADRLNDPCLQDVADATGASMPSVSRAVDSLVRKELVLRIEDPEDRRRRILALTDEGREIVHQILLGRAAGVIRLAADFEPDERAELNRVLGRMIKRDDLAPIYAQLEEAMTCRLEHPPATTETEAAR